MCRKTRRRHPYDRARVLGACMRGFTPKHDTTVAPDEWQTMTCTHTNINAVNIDSCPENHYDPGDLIQNLDTPGGVMPLTTLLYSLIYYM